MIFVLALLLTDLVEPSKQARDDCEIGDQTPSSTWFITIGGIAVVGS
jgi:hypothetical protein